MLKTRWLELPSLPDRWSPHSTPILTYLPGATGAELGGPEDIDQSLSDMSPTIVLDVETGERVPHFAEIDVRSRVAEQRSTMIRPVVRLRDASAGPTACRSS